VCEICCIASLPPPNTQLTHTSPWFLQGVKCLNRIQSIVFPTAYTTNENMLVCAPTGAGKTNVAMLTILRTIEQHIEKGVIMRDQFKIVYVAPMKALAAEMADNFGRKLAPLGVTVRELTGDMQLTKTEIMATNMLITTPEKWDVVTRKSTGDVALTQIVKLLIIDEVHLLHDDRGPVIESLVARTLRQVRVHVMMDSFLPSLTANSSHPGRVNSVAHPYRRPLSHTSKLRRRGHVSPRQSLRRALPF
jgi:activating signal cointegrator complex subunit 3